MAVKKEESENKYLVKKDNFSIWLTIRNGKEYTITTAGGKEGFMFKNSKPETIRTIAYLLAEASEVKE